MNTVKGITMRLVTSRTTFSVAAFVALVLLPAGPANAQKSAALVEVDKVIVEPLSQTMPVLGRFVARQSGPVAALVSGPVEDILVDVGDRVRKGDILVRLATDVTIGNRNLRAAELREKEAALETARADTELASLELRRLENLRKSPAFSQARYEDKRAEVVRFKSKVAEAEAGVARARANLGLANLDLGRAEDAAEAASELAGSGDTLLAGLSGMVAGQAEEARSNLQAAVDHYAAAATLEGSAFPPELALLNQGRCLDGLGRTQEAIEAYQKVLDIYPDSPLAARAGRKLQELRGTGS